MQKRSEQHEKHLYNGGALVSAGVILYSAAVVQSAEAVLCAFGVFVAFTTASLLRKVSKYKNGRTFLDEIKTLSLSKDGVSLEMKEDGPDESS